MQIVLLAQLLVTLLWFDQVLGALQTTMGWWVQITMMVVGVVIIAATQGVVLFFAAQAIHGQRPHPQARIKQDFLLGASLALALMGYRCLLQAWIYPDGSLHELVHKLPEGRVGAKLSREQAIAKAQEWIRTLNWANPELLEEKSVEEIQRPGFRNINGAYITNHLITR